MSGIYVHIPYCRKACTYCNFHFSTQTGHKGAMVKALVREIAMQEQYLAANKINTIYFGGGTPSVLEEEEIKQIIDALRQQYSVESDAEITFEINPDDASPSNLAAWKKQGINRLSIGVQSFQEAELVFMNRSHSAQQSKDCIAMARAAGFENISIDLIYGSYETSNTIWQKNIETFLKLNIPHLSAYALTVEPKTKLSFEIAKGKLAEPNEAKTIEQFEILMDQMAQNNFEHYEISNFARPGWQAVHNSNYWTGQNYLGIGPSAHSFNGSSRQWNIANNIKYIEAIEKGDLPFELENLSPDNIYNEYVMTSLRTSNGCTRENITTRFKEQHLQAFDTAIKKQMAQGNIEQREQRFVLSRQGKFIANSVMADFFV